MLHLAKIFTDNMVLQRDKRIPLWGEASPKAPVTVSFNGRQAGTEADDRGQFILWLPPHEAGSGYTLTVSSGEESISLKGVCVGEVWLAGGQSNMEFPLGFDADFEQALKKEENPNIRFFNYPQVSYEGQLADFDYAHDGFWREGRRDEIQYFSAVGYYFAKNLQENLHIPIGIIGCNWGGTPAAAWMNPQKLKGTAGEFWLTRHIEEVEDMDSYAKKFKENPLNNRSISPMEDPIRIKMVKEGLLPEEQQMMAQLAANMEDIFTKIGPYHEKRPGGLHETMLKNLVPYGIRGVIWYQGETDSEENPEAYRETFSRLIEDWRELWKEELPFLFVQLAPFEKWMGATGDSFPVIRDCQEFVAGTVPGTWMAASGDAGMQWDIHPKKKEPIGRRLALLARGHVYGERILCDAPEFSSVKRQRDTLELSFSHGQGLHLKGDILQAMQAKRRDGTEKSVTAAKILGDRLVLSEMEDVVELSFAKTGYYEVNLFNGAGIPVKPFHCRIE